MPGLMLLLTGCGGISASPSISPASFFLPGLMKAAPPAPEPLPGQALPEQVFPVEPGCLLAQF